MIHDREVISDAPGQNATIWTMKGKPATTARAEYAQLFEEIVGLLNQ